MKIKSQTMIGNAPAKYGLILIICAAVIAAWAEGNMAAPGASDILVAKQYQLAYESLSTAEWLAGREMNQDAVDLYNEALQKFRQISADFPQWHTNLVAFRINYCREGLEKITKPPAPDMDLKKTAAPAAEPPRTQEALRQALPPEPAGADKENGVKIAEAARLEGAGDLPGALEIYKALLAQQKQNPAALGGAGRCLLKLGKVTEARELLFQWSVIPSPDNGINLLLALVFSRDRQYAKAIQLADIVINEDASNAGAHVILGVALAGVGQTDQAIAEMNKAVTLNPGLNEAHYNLALLMLKKGPGQAATAKACYLNALKFGAAPDPDLAKRLQK
jgi:tetratricopeptide (TPR) repeat protein